MNEIKPTNATPATGAEEYLVRVRTAIATNGDSKPIKGAITERASEIAVGSCCKKPIPPLAD